MNFTYYSVSKEDNPQNRGLSELYNAYIKIHPEADVFVFRHDDLEIHDSHLEEKIQRAHYLGFDIYGAAGSKDFHIQNPDVRHGWWQEPEKSGWMTHRIGDTHRMSGNEQTTYYGPIHNGAEPVAVVDGCFLAISRRAIDKGLRFDEDFKFHHYDVSLCLRAKGLGLKTAVLPLFLTHTSPGYGFLSDDFLQSQKMLCVKYAKCLKGK